MSTDPIRKAAIRFRAAIHIDLAAARLGAEPRDYFLLYPNLRKSIARRAIQDVQAALTGEFPRDGLTDAEALQEARLWQFAWGQPTNQEGFRKSQEARLERARIRAKGMARVREREAGRLRGELINAEAAE
jgi:hypothetical protein